MMGDTNVETVSRHYLNLQCAPDDEVIAKWDLPNTLLATVAQLAEFASDLTNETAHRTARARGSRKPRNAARKRHARTSNRRRTALVL